jgi:hypothetical protein
MIELFSLIKGFNAEEFQIVKHSFNKNKKDSNLFLMGRLFDAIQSNPKKVISDVQLCQVVYKEEKNTAIGKLKSRLFYHILEVLGSENSLLKEEIFDPSDRLELRIRKKIHHFRVLYRKKNNADYITLLHLLNEVIKEAKEAELYDVVLEALRHKMLFLTIREGFREVAEIKKQINYYSSAYDALLRTYEIYYNLMTNIIHVQNKSAKQIEASLKFDLKEIEGYIKEFGSGFITYMYNMIKLEQKQREKKYSQCIDICLDLISLLKQKKFLYREERMGNIYDNISQSQVYNHNFSDAIKSVRLAQKFYSKNLLSYSVSKEQEFDATFYSGDYKSALSIINYILSLSIDSVGDFAEDRYLFLKSCVYFKLAKFKESISICNEALELTKDKGRWDIGVRYVRIMNMIELGNDKLADDAIEALRRSFTRNDKNVFISDRDKLILKALKEYCNSGFNQIPTDHLLELIGALSVSNSENSWQYYSHERFPIQDWILSRLDPSKIKVAIYKRKR